MKAPPGYVRLESELGTAWVVAAAADWAQRVLEDGTTLHAWAAGRPDARPMEGRGTVWDVAAPVPGPDGRARWAVRHFRRGGAVAGPLLDDRYLASPDAPRPLRELCCSARIRRRGLPTPAVVAAAVYPAGIFYRGDLVTELVPGGVDLRDLLFGGAGTGGAGEGGAGPGEGAAGDAAGPDPEAALEAVGRLVRRLERAGVYHPDLNAANLLLAGDDPPEAWLLDLDRCQARDEGTPAPVGPMGDRLRRSLRKLERTSGRTLPEGCWAALARGLEAGA